MKRNIKRLPALLLAIILCLSLLPGTAWAANFPTKFYASVNYDYSSYSKSVIFGTVTQSSSGDLSYEGFGEKTDRVVYGMEYAGGVFYTVEGTKLNKNADDGFRELRMYNSDLTSYRTIGTVNQEGGGYWIVDTAMDLSGDELALYGTYNTVIPDVVAMSVICTIDLETATPGNYLQVTGLPNMHIIYAITFDEDGTLYAIGADGGADGGPATLYTIDLDNVQTGSYGSQTVAATKVADIKSQTGSDISTNFCQDLAFDHATSTLYWMENKSEVLYTVDTKTAAATRVGSLPTLQSFCIPYDAAFGQGKDKHMISVICEGAGTVTSSEDEHPFYMVEDNGSITLTLTPDAGSGLRYVKVDGKNVSLDGLVENGYTFTDVTKNHVIEVGFKLAIPATQKTVTWLHYQGEPASFYTKGNVYKFYDLPYLDNETPRDGYTQTLLDEDGEPIPDNEIILPGNYDVHVTHPGNAEYAALDVTYEDALQLEKCPGTPGRPVVYGKVGCKQGDLTTTSALQDYYGTDGTLIDSAHDEIPVTLVWLNPETIYNEVGNFYASATIYAADKLEQRLKDCYTLDDGSPLTENCLISSRATQVVVLPADEASLIKLLTSDASGGTVSGKGVYKNGETVTVTAAVNTNAGYEFKGWQENGSVVSTEATYTFNAEKDRTLTALFEVNEDYRVTLQADPQNGGTVTGGGSYEADNHEATVTATANQGYYFIGWYKAGQEEAVNTNTEHTFAVPEDGATLTAKFGVDYLYQAEQAKETFASAVSTDAFEWQTLVQAVDAYKAAESVVQSPPSGIQNAQDRYDALTTYYSGVEALDLSNQGISSADLAKLYLFTGVTELNLSGNKGVTGLTALKDLTQLETLDISGTGVTTADVLVSGDALSFPGLKTLTAQNLSLTSLSALAKAAGADGFNTDAVTKWDFTGSTLTDTEDNKADVETIKTTLGEKFSPPTIQTTPDEPEIPATPVNPGGVTTYAVTVEDAENGKVTRSPARAGRGTTVTITTAPDDGYELDKLTVTDARGSELELTDKGNGKYTFRMPASKVTVEAVFTEILPEPLPFIDVDEDAWYADAVRYVYEHDLMAGYGGDLFGPNDELSRAQFCQIIYNMEGQPAVTGSSAFTDVADGAWYANVVTWAAENGIVVGYGGGLFGPEDNITREQFAAILYRYAQAKGYGTTASFDLSAYGDVSDVSAWAISAMQWACGKDIIIGTSPTTLAPQGTATRAQAATMLQRFCEQYSQNEG